MKRARSKYSLILNKGISSLIIKVAGLVLALLSTLLFARTLGPAGMGRYSVIFSVFSLLVIPVQLGLPQLIIRETAKALSDGNWHLIRGVWYWSKAVIVLGSVLLVGLVFGWIVIEGKTYDESRIYLFGLAFVPLFSLLTAYGGALVGLGRVIGGQIPEHIVKPLLLIVSVLYFSSHYSSREFSPADAMGCQMFSVGFAFLASVYLLLRALPIEIKSSLKGEVHSASWVLSVASLGLLKGMYVVMGNLDIVMLGWLRPIDEAGVYRVVLAGAVVVSFGVQAMNLVVMPSIARMSRANEDMELQRLVDSSIRFVMVVGVLTFFVVVLFGQWMLGAFFGEDYVIGYWPLVILSLGQLLHTAFGPLGALMNMSGYERDTLTGLFLAAVLNAVLNLALVPELGMIGAAVSSSIGLIVCDLYLYRRARIKTGVNCLVRPELLKGRA